MSAKSEELEQKLKGEEASSSGEVCACCGVAAVDDVKLKDCDGGCDLVKYCRDDCQINHREQHEEECNKRKAELRDKQLFTQPDISFLGECPLCCLPLSLRPGKSTLNTCCSNIICEGCNYANKKREFDQGLKCNRCAFCREPLPKSDEEIFKRIMKRVKKNDPVAMIDMGKRNSDENEYGKALQYWTKAAELGGVEAHFYLGYLYYQGKGTDKDEKKAVYHFEQAAIGGHPQARAGLACMRRTMAGSIEQPNITSLLRILDMIIR
jgi:hypothetical protein